MIDLCEMTALTPEEARLILDELLAEYRRQIALRPIDYKEPPEGFLCAMP